MAEFSFEALLRDNLAHYPSMTVRDCAKLAFQSEFGPEHLLDDPSKVCAGILRELEILGSAAAYPEQAEAVSGTLCRCPIAGLKTPEEAEALSLLMLDAAQREWGSADGIIEKAKVIRSLGLPDEDGFMESWVAAGYPPVHHSKAFRTAYNPCYRLAPKELVCYIGVIARILEVLKKGKRPVIAAIEGCCASGKTVLSDALERIFSCGTVHMDDFYLPFERRVPDWRSIPGANMDYERFNAEITAGIAAGGDFAYRPYNCMEGVYSEPVTVKADGLIVVEGSYCRHPDVRLKYDLSVYLRCSKAEQLRRLEARERGACEGFIRQWIPAEEKYSKIYRIPETSDIVCVTD